MLSGWRSSWCGGLRSQSASSFIFALVCVAAATLVRLALGLLSRQYGVCPLLRSDTRRCSRGWSKRRRFGRGGGGIVALFLFIPPEWGRAFFPAAQIVSVRLFAASAVVIIWAAESYRSPLQRLREEEASRELLNHETNHRIKNLASVQAILYQTLRDNKEIRDWMIARVTSLVATNAVLRSNWHSASLQEILVREFSPYGLSRFQIRGEDVECPSEVAILLALVVHELTTNALKYGALSRTGGWVSRT